MTPEEKEIAEDKVKKIKKVIAEYLAWHKNLLAVKEATIQKLLNFELDFETVVGEFQHLPDDSIQFIVVFKENEHVVAVSCYANKNVEFHEKLG